MELDGYAVDGCASACCDLDLWPFDLISISQSQVHTWCNFWWKYLRRYCIHPVCLVIACCDLDLWPFDPKTN